jgi:hypothetical protein
VPNSGMYEARVIETCVEAGTVGKPDACATGDAPALWSRAGSATAIAASAPAAAERNLFKLLLLVSVRKLRSRAVWLR